MEKIKYLSDKEDVDLLVMGLPEGEMGKNVIAGEIPAGMKAEADKYRAELVERIVEKPVEVIKEVIKEIPVERIVEVEKIVEKLPDDGARFFLDVLIPYQEHHVGIG